MNKLLLAIFTLLTAASHALGQEQQEKLYLWTGFVQPDEGKAIQEMQEPLTQEQVEARIAEVQHDLLTLRDTKAAEAAIDHLWLQVNFKCSMDPDERKEQLIAVALARSEIFTYSQSWNNAKKALGNLALTKADTSPGRPPMLASISQSHGRWLEQIAEDVRIKRGIIKINKKSQSGTVDGPQIRPGLSKELEAYVLGDFGTVDPRLILHIEKSLRSGSSEAITQLGSRSAPSLAYLILQDLDTAKEIFSIDPFWVLQQVSSEAVFRIIKDHFPSASDDWKYRAFHTYKERRTQIFRMSEPKDKEFSLSRIPHSDEVLGHFVRNEQTRSAAIIYAGSLKSYFFRQADGHLSSALAEVFDDCDTEQKVQITHYTASMPEEDLITIATKAISSEHSNLRAVAVNSIRLCPGSYHYLYPLAEDPDPEVRRTVAWAFIARSSYLEGYTKEDFLELLETDEAQAALLKLVEDPAPEVRDIAIQSLTDKEGWMFPNVELYIAAIPHLTRSPKKFFLLPFPNLEAKKGFVNAAASSTNRMIIGELDHNFKQLEWDSEHSVYREALLTRSQDSNIPFPIPRQDYVERFDAVQFKASLAGRMYMQGQAALAIKVFTDMKDIESIKHLNDPVRLTKAFKILPIGYAQYSFENAPNESRNLIQSAGDRISKSSSLNDEYFSNLSRDPDASDYSRLLAGIILIERGSSLAEATAFGLLSEKNLDSSFLKTRITNAFFQDPDRHQEFLHNIAWMECENEGLQILFLAGFKHSRSINSFVEPLLMSLLHESQRKRSLYAEELFQEISEKGLTNEHWESIARIAMEAGNGSEQSALRCIKKSQASSFIKPLGEIICKTVESGADTNRVSTACIVLASFRTKEAADELLSCIGRASSEFAKDRILKELDDLRTYYEQRSYWASFETAAPSKDTAADELLAMLRAEDPQIREAALLGLIPLGKAEVIPRVIPLLKDENESVRKAAKQVLGALQKVRVADDED